MAFHPKLPVAWVLNELDSTLTTCLWDETKGVLSPLDVTSTLPGDFAGDNQTAEIEFVAATNTLYASNRGHNSIVSFRINRTTGMPRLIGWQPSGGDSPRFFAPGPDGQSLMVANWKSDAIKRFDMDTRSGALTPTRQTIKTPSPIAIAFVRGD
jgi:6-phosphogluconolactonase (cycloisomerase 2 family)